MPGTEVAVAPKRRKKNLDSGGDSHLDISTKEYTTKMLLRIQEPDRLCYASACVKGIELNMGLTSIAFVHPETAKHFSLSVLQLVSIVPRLSREDVNSSRTNIMKSKSPLITKEVDNGNLTDKKDTTQAIVHLLTSESVAKGHVMIVEALRLYLRVGLHSCMANSLIYLSHPIGLYNTIICPHS